MDKTEYYQTVTGLLTAALSEDPELLEQYIQTVDYEGFVRAWARESVEALKTMTVDPTEIVKEIGRNAALIEE